MPTLPKITNFNALQALSSFESGNAFAVKQNQLGKLAQQLQAGANPGDLAAKALAVGDRQTFNALHSLANTNHQNEFRVSEATRQQGNFETTVGLKQSRLNQGTTKYRDYKAAQTDPAFGDFMLKQSKAKGTNVNISNVGNNTPLSKSVTSKQQNKIINDTELLSGLRSIQNAYKPEFQTFQGVFNQGVQSLKSKLGIKLDPAQRKGLQEFAVFKQRALKTLSERLNALSGAAVSPQEAKRIQATLPDPNVGLFSGDGPVAFQAKLNEGITGIKMAIARKNYMLKQGIPGKPWERFALSDMRGIINQEGARIAGQVKQQNPQLDDATINQMVKLQLSNMFGIGQ